MATYTAVVTLMHDLEQLLSSYGDVFGLEQGCYAFTKEEIEILYHNVSLMDSLLRDSSGESYNREFMTQILEERIGDVARKAQNYVDFWVVECYKKLLIMTKRIVARCLYKYLETDYVERRLAKGHTLSQLIDEAVTSFVDKQQNPIGVGGVQDLDAISLAGTFLSRSKRTRNTKGKVVGLNKELEAIVRRFTMNEITVAIITKELQNIRDARKVQGSEVVASSGGLTLNKITEEIVSIKEELQKILDDTKIRDLEVISSQAGESLTFLTPSRRTPNTENKVVGLDKDLETMLDSLTGHASQFKVFAIIGMAGIGKTTFAQTLYHSPNVMHHFYVRAWVSISQQYQVREVLLGILCCVTNVSDEIYVKSNEELSEQLYRSLKGRRYFIVLDDMWDTKAWDDLKIIFPDDRNGSRIMLTSRLRDVAVYASQDTPPHCLRSLSIDESWELLSSKIFVDESYPMELLAIGKHIAHKC